mmetsp:Transcript_28067/g.58321  ORF Transcript_28067/g.58321 Transcript_28067/m.58321 type:complete len:292 (-) Transcript_28067:180-1055(-)
MLAAMWRNDHGNTGRPPETLPTPRFLLGGSRSAARGGPRRLVSAPARSQEASLQQPAAPVATASGDAASQGLGAFAPPPRVAEVDADATDEASASESDAGPARREGATVATTTRSGDAGAGGAARCEMAPASALGAPITPAVAARRAAAASGARAVDPGHAPTPALVVTPERQQQSTRAAAPPRAAARALDAQALALECAAVAGGSSARAAATAGCLAHRGRTPPRTSSGAVGHVRGIPARLSAAPSSPQQGLRAGPLVGRGSGGSGPLYSSGALRTQGAPPPPPSRSVLR